MCFLSQIQKLNQAKIQEEIYDIFNYIVTFKSKGMGFDCCARRPRIQKFLLGTIHTSYGNRIGQLTSLSTMSFEIVPFLPSLALASFNLFCLRKKAGRCLRKLDA